MAVTKQNPAPELSKVEVIKELAPEKVIEQTLTKNNVTNRVIAALKEKYGKGDLVLRTLDDTENYLIICEAKKSVRKIGIITEKICKEGRSEAIKIQKMWLDKQAEILGKIAEVQDPLDAEIKKYEDEQSRLEQVEEERKDEQFNIRQAQLIKMGSVSANGCMNINDLSIENSSIREADDETYNETILPLFKMHYEKNEAKRVEEEKQKQKEKEELEKQQNELKQQQQQMKEQQELLDKQKREFEEQQQQLKNQKIANRKMQLEVIGMSFSFKDDVYVFDDVKISNHGELCVLDDAEWEILLQATKPLIETRKKQAAIKEERKNIRSVQLSELGMTFTGNAYKFDDINIPATDITGMEDVNWNELIATTTPMIADRKQKSEEKKQQEWQKQQDEEKEKQKRQQEEENAKASDKEKWANFIALLNQFAIGNMPEFKSSIYKNKRQITKEKLEEILSL